MHRRITYSLFLLTLLTGMGSFGPPFGRLSTAQTVKNGDFSNGLTGWTQRIISGGIFAGFPKFLTFSSLRCLPSQQGNPFFALDVPGDADGILEQQVTIPPASVTNGAVLSLRSWGSNEPVTVTISIVPTGQAEVILESYRPPLIENFPNCTGNLPVVKSYDLAAFARQTVTLRLRGTCMRVVGPCFNGA
ncbi:MAG: hypothetical protein FJZ47_17300, partial [Candidatus Tectomicrobia bacterium]|nr:hypothetical protein [Candidatus Tectomicrobia bacterium]